MKDSVVVFFFAAFLLTCASSALATTSAGDDSASSLPQLGGPAQILTLDDALSAARDHNPELKKLSYKADAARLGKWAAISGYLPHLSAQAVQYFDAQYAQMGILFGTPPNPIFMPQAFPQADMRLEASMTIFDGLATYNNFRAASETAQAADLQYGRASFQLDESVRMQFWKALAASLLAQVADQNIKTLNDHLKLVREGRHAGVSTNYDVLRIEAELDEAQAQKLLADDNKADSERDLLDLLGVLGGHVELRGDLPAPSRDRIPANLNLDLSKRQDVAAQTKMELAASHKNMAALGAWFPRVELFADEDYYHFGAFSPMVVDQPGYQNDWAYGVRLTWNIFDGGASIANKGIEKDLYEEERQSTRRLDLTSTSEFARWRRRYLYNCALYEASLHTVDKSQESVRLAQIGVRAGVKTNTEALDAELELFRARAGVIQSQVDAAEALAKLELAVGHRLY